LGEVSSFGGKLPPKHAWIKPCPALCQYLSQTHRLPVRKFAGDLRSAGHAHSAPILNLLSLPTQSEMTFTQALGIVRADTQASPVTTISPPTLESFNRPQSTSLPTREVDPSNFTQFIMQHMYSSYG